MQLLPEDLTRPVQDTQFEPKSHSCANVHDCNMKPNATAQLLSIPSYFVFDRSRARILACRIVTTDFSVLTHSLHEISRII